VAEDLMEDGTIWRISDAYSLRRGRRQPPTSEVKELQFVIVIVCNVKKEIKPPHREKLYPYGGRCMCLCTM
jgi:hypothetical protein